MTLDLPAMLARKDEVVKGLTDGVRFLFRRTDRDDLRARRGSARRHSVQVALNEGGSVDLQTGHILLATGSEPVELPFLPFDGRTVVDSTGALSFDRVPDHLVVVGAGYIGLELGSVWKRLGAKVTVLEFLPRIVPTADQEMGDLLKKSLAKQGLEFHLETKVTGASIEGDRATVHAEKKDGTEARLSSATGCWSPSAGGRSRKGLGLAEVGVSVDPKTGKVPVDAHFRTNVADDLGDRRLDRRPDAGPQGRGRGDRLRRDPGGQAGPRQLRHDPGRDLHLARTGQRRADRRAGEGAGARITGSASSRSWPTAAPRRWTKPRGWSRSWPTRRPTGCWACTSSARGPRK